MAHHIFPTENNVGTFEGYPARDIREKSFVKYIRRRGRSRLESFVTYGHTLSAGTGLSVNVAAGGSFINGHQIESDAVENLAGLTASNTNYIWAALTKDGNGLVTDYALSANITGTPPTDSVLLGIAVTGASTVSSVTNSASNPTVVTGTYVGDSVTNRTIFLGFQPKYVLVIYTNYGSGAIHVGFSGIAVSEAGFYVDSAATLGAVFPAIYNYQSPLITAFGFSVGHNVNSSLNYSGITYRYVAWSS